MEDPRLEPEVDWNTLAHGRVMGETPVVLDDAAVDAYLQATGEEHPLYAPGDAGGFAPPLFTTMVRFAKAALGGRWPSGTIQLDQRVAMRRALRRGERLTLDLRVEREPTHTDRRVVRLLSALRDAAGRVAGEQSAALLWAGGGRGAGGDAAIPSSTNPVRGPIGPVACDYPIERLRAFGDLAGARDPIHLDPAFAAGTRYRVNIAQGRLVMALVARLMLERHGVDWLQRGWLDLRFRRPVLVGATVRAWATPDRDGQRYDVCCEDDRGIAVITGSAGLASTRSA
jgi:acyl dehydratase